VYTTVVSGDACPRFPEPAVCELDPLVGDEMPWLADGQSQGSSQEGSDGGGRWLLVEHGESHDPAGEVIGDAGNPPAERPTLKKGEGQSGCPEFPLPG
jgi:hypothetical protein